MPETFWLKNEQQFYTADVEFTFFSGVSSI